MKTILTLTVIILLTSCSVVNKIFHKSKSQVDSTSVTHQKKDSVVEKSTIDLHKDSSSSKFETVINWGDSKMVIPYKPDIRDSGIYYWPTNPNDYFEITKDGTVKTNRIPKSVVIKGNASGFNYDSLVDHSKITTSEVNDNTNHVQKKEKEVVKEVSKKKFLWWLLLLIPAYLIYRNRAKIKAWIMLILPI